MLELEQAQQQILSAVRPLGRESVPLLSAVGRVLAETVTSPRDLPPFDNSAMDGYAVRSQDLAQAGPEKPVTLQLVGQVAAGDVFPGELMAGQCVRLFTGSPVPAGADAVIQQEDTRVLDTAPDQRLMLDRVRPWENLRFRGEDVKQGESLAQRGDRLTVSQIGLLAAAGCSALAVGTRPVIGLVATGSELREPGEAPSPGQIYESNRVTLAALASSAGAQPRIYPLVKDSLADTRSALAKALSECDAVITSGGVSVGELDFVKAAFEELGGRVSFWKVAIKPGKPFVLGTWREKLLFGLPGNPVSAFVTFVLLVRPALLQFQGAAQTQPPSNKGTLAEPFINSGDRRHFVRVRLDSEGQVHLTGSQASHLLHSLARANGLVDVPPKTTLGTGTPVSVLGWM